MSPASNGGIIRRKWLWVFPALGAICGFFAPEIWGFFSGL